MRQCLNITACVLCFFALLFSYSSVSAGEVNILGHGGVSFNKQVKSYKEQLFDSVIRQRYDFSCGSAALATLLYHHYYYDVDERQVLKAMYRVGDQQKILKKGFSLLDMKNYLASEGINSDGYKMDLDKLGRIGVPSIALINKDGYLHFVVIKGIFGDQVLMGDPSLGTRKIDRKKFEKMWNGIAFVIKDQIPLAKSNFNLAADWNVRAKVPLGSELVSEALANITSNVTEISKYYY